MAAGFVKVSADMQRVEGDVRATAPLLRALNERAVLDVIRRAAPISRAEVARQSGISKPTVSSALQALLDAGPGARGRAAAGRAELRRRVLRAGARRRDRARHRHRRPVPARRHRRPLGRHPRAPGRRAARRRRGRRAGGRGRGARLAARGVAARRAPGRLGRRRHARRGRPGRHDRPRRRRRRPRRRGVHAGAARRGCRSRSRSRTTSTWPRVGEQWGGVAQGVDDFAVLSVGTGTGVGIVLGGELHRGRHGAAGEIDLAYAGLGLDIDPCAAALEAYATPASAATTRARPRCAPPYDTPAVFAAARAGDELAAQVVAEAARRIAANIVPIAAVADVSLVVLGGGIGANGDLLLTPVRTLLQTGCRTRPRSACRASASRRCCTAPSPRRCAARSTTSSAAAAPPRTTKGAAPQLRDDALR